MTASISVEEVGDNERLVIYTCHYCKQCHNSLKALKSHLGKTHSEHFASVSQPKVSEQTKNVCFWCQKHFSTVYKMRDHVKTKHKEYFNRLPPLKRIRRDDFPCKHCHKSFSSIYKLRSHVSRQHAELASYLPPLQRLRGTAVLCEICKKTFSTINNLRKHCSGKHPDQQDLVAPPKKRKDSFICTVCNKSFTGNHRFRRHQRSHNFNNTNYSIRNRYKCPLCDFSIHGHIKLIYSHFENKHDVKIAINNFEFDNMISYETWKNDLEKTTRSFFVRSNQKKKDQACYLRCHRSGRFKSKSQGIRHLKSRGSNKINGFCPASILVKLKDERVKVRFIETHVGHELDLKYLPLNKEDKKFCTSKIAANIPLDEILLEIKNDSNEKVQERINLITKKDLMNIRRSFLEAGSSEDFSHHQQDILFYKPRKVSCLEYPEFEENDFAIALMTKEQKNILKTSSPSVICISGTQSMLKHNFDIFVISILGKEKHYIFPAAFFITSKSNQITLCTFFNHVLQAIGKQLKPDILLVDLDKRMLSAWIHVMGEPTNFFYSPWAITREWIKHLSKLSKQAAIIAFINLLNLLWSPDIKDKFKNLLDSTVKTLMSNSKTSEFGQYFADSFSTNYVKWACCYQNNRVDSEVMFYMEHLHNLISSVIPRGLRGINIAALINSLHHYTTEEVFLSSGALRQSDEHFIKSFHQHEKFLKRFLPNSIYQVSNIFYLLSFKGNSCNYFCVKRKSSQCSCETKLCDRCNLCPHMFECCCTKGIEKFICEHIHVVNTHITTSMVSQDIHYEEVTTDQNLWNIEYEVVILDSDVEPLLESSSVMELNINSDHNNHSDFEDVQKNIVLEFEVNETNNPALADKTDILNP